MLESINNELPGTSAIPLVLSRSVPRPLTTRRVLSLKGVRIHNNSEESISHVAKNEIP